MKTRIIVDSTIDLMPESKARVHIVPLTVHFGEEEYIDGVTIQHETFYQKLVETDVLPTTSQATPHAFSKALDAAKAAGEAALILTISSKLSGTCQSAAIAAAEYENVYIVDSGSTTIGGSILTELALRYLDAGMDASAIAKQLEEDKQKIVLIALVDTLEYLQKGGRISKTAALAGSLLRIKPVISLLDGEIAVLGKARGSKMGNNLLVQAIEKAGGIDFEKPVLLGYTGLSDALLRKYIEDSEYLWGGHPAATRYTSIGSVVGTHVGPGAIAIAFFKK